VPVSVPDADGQALHTVQPGFAHVSYQKLSFFGQLIDGAIADGCLLRTACMSAACQSG
jgi:hypothetical protein